MKKTIRYHEANIMQRQINKFMNLFKRDYVKIEKLKEKDIKVYTPKLNKVKVSVGVVGCVGCLLTPFTNWFIPFIIGWMIR